MPIALFISPHLDDVASSCAGTLMRLAASGWDVALLTVFTATVPDPQGFALRCQTDKGLGPDVDYMALRRAEDADFARIAGIDDVRLWPFAEAPHRGYGSPADLFAGTHDGDEVWRPIAEELASIAASLAPDAVFAPQGLGNHVDHLQVIRAVGAAGLAPLAFWYRDTPYALREPSALPSLRLPGGLQDRAVGIDDALERKIAGCCAYLSQIAFQFGGADKVRRKLTEFHRAEAEHAGRAGHAERLLVPAAATLLEGLFF